MMAQFDVYTGQVISNVDTVQCSNLFYFQCVDEVDFDLTLSEIAAWIENVLVEDMKKFSSDQVSFRSAIVRRIKPAMTDVLVTDFNAQGDLPTGTLPSTVCAIARYYCSPYEAQQTNHWKIAGVPKDANNRGLMTDEGILRYADFIQTVTQSPYVMGQNSFSLIRPPKDSDVAEQALPIIYKSFVNGKLANLRSRQEY